MAKEILIVDSDMADQEEFKRVFDTTDYHAIFCENGENALFRVKLYKPELIIATSRIGQKTGLELCQTLKSDPELADIPFVLLTEIFDDVSDKDRVHLDGILSKPFERGEILDLADRLSSKGERGMGEEIHVQDEEEIIDLFEVVEEPEPQMSIEDLIATDREITSSQELPEVKRLEEEKPEKERLFFPEETERKKEIELPPEEQVSSQGRLSDDKELEEILEKVERLKPTLEEEEKPDRQEIQGGGQQASLGEKPPEDLMSLEEFETILKAPVTVEEPDLKEFLSKEPKEENQAETSPKEMTLEEELTLFEESLEGSKTGSPIQSPLTEKSVEAGVAEGLTLSEAPLEELRAQSPVETPPLQEKAETGATEELTLFEVPSEEAKEQSEIETIPSQEEARAGVLEELTLFEAPFEEIKGQPETQTTPTVTKVVNEAGEEMILFEESLEEMKTQPETGTFTAVNGREIKVEEEELSELSEEEFPEALLEEVLKEEEIGLVGARKEKEIGPVEEADAPTISQEPKIGLEPTISPVVRAVDRKIEDVITKGLQNMMEDFITKVVPEMTQNVIVLTMERIEKMVKEIVPELTEKAVQEEIKRLQKGEKD